MVVHLGRGRAAKWGRGHDHRLRVHHYVNSIRTLLPYLPLRWQRYVEESGFQGPAASPYPKGSPYAARIDAAPPDGGIPGSDLPFLREQLLDRWEIEYAILHCLYNLWSVQNEDFALALARAVNDWTLAEWLEKEPRLRAGIVVPINNPDLAADGDRPARRPARFVEVLLPVRSDAPYGRRRSARSSRPRRATACRSASTSAATPATRSPRCGWPSIYMEDHTGCARRSRRRSSSLVCEGVFEEFPELRSSLLEGGFAWLPGV